MLIQSEMKQQYYAQQACGMVAQGGRYSQRSTTHTHYYHTTNVYIHGSFQLSCPPWMLLHLCWDHSFYGGKMSPYFSGSWIDDIIRKPSSSGVLNTSWLPQAPTPLSFTAAFQSLQVIIYPIIYPMQFSHCCLQHSMKWVVDETRINWKQWHQKSCMFT